MHKNSKETYDYISKWVNPNLFHSENDRWGRMGFLGIFGDMVLSCLPFAHIVEIGCGESSIYLSHLARKFKRNIYHCDIAPDKIINPVSVPGYMHTEELHISEKNRMYQYGYSHFFMGPSDRLFQSIQNVPLALTFVDGDHVYEQAKKDFENAMKLTLDNGYVILHDTMPPSEAYLSPDSACGDVYKLRQEIEADEKYDSLTLPYGVAMDVGLTLVRKKSNNLPYYQR